MNLVLLRHAIWCQLSAVRYRIAQRESYGHSAYPSDLELRNKLQALYERLNTLNLG
jgi:hypothetical protein